MSMSVNLNRVRRYNLPTTAGIMSAHCIIVQCVRVRGYHRVSVCLLYRKYLQFRFWLAGSRVIGNACEPAYASDYNVAGDHECESL